MKKEEIKEINKKVNNKNKKDDKTVKEIRELYRIIMVLSIMILAIFMSYIGSYNQYTVTKINKEEVLNKIQLAESEFKRQQEFEIKVMTNELKSKELINIKQDKTSKFLVHNFVNEVRYYGELKSAKTIIVDDIKREVIEERPILRYIDKFNFNPFYVGNNIDSENIKVSLTYVNSLIPSYKIEGKIEGIEFTYYVDTETFLPILKVEKSDKGVNEYLIKYIKREIKEDEIKEPNITGYKFEGATVID